MAVGVPAAHVGHRQPLHERPQLPRRPAAPRPQQQVPVVGHQAVRQQPHRGKEFERPGQHPLERRVVPVVVEHRRAAVAAVEHVVHVSAGGASGGAGHPRSLPELAGAGKGNERIPFSRPPFPGPVCVPFLCAVRIGMRPLFCAALRHRGALFDCRVGTRSHSPWIKKLKELAAEPRCTDSRVGLCVSVPPWFLYFRVLTSPQASPPSSTGPCRR
jgi:hypothetical protein